MDWDIEAQEHAYREAQRLQRRDPEAAALLMAQLVVTQEYQRKQRQEQGAGLQALGDLAVYNPISLYAYVTLKTGWRHAEMECMHYITFFAYIREFLEHDRRERAAMQTGMPAPTYYPGNFALEFPA